MKNFKTLMSRDYRHSGGHRTAANAATIVRCWDQARGHWQTAGIGAYKLAGAGAGHYTVKGEPVVPRRLPARNC